MSFTAHMILHVTLVAVLAPLLAVAAGGTRLDPVAWAPRLFAPVPAALLEFVVVWGWHVPVMHLLGREHHALWLVEQGSFLAVGLWVWLAAFGGPEARRKARSAGGVVALLLTSMHMTLLGALLVLAPRPLYPYAGLVDQQVGGVIMLFAGATSYLVGGLWLVGRLLARPAVASDAAGLRERPR